MRKYTSLTSISILCFISGFLSFSFIENFTLENFKNYNLAYSQMNTQFLNTWKFAIICGISPLGINSIWKKTNVEKSYSKIISIILLLLTIILFIIFRFSLMRSELDSQKSLDYPNLTTVEHLDLLLNIFIGEILGLVIMYIFLNKAKSRE